MLSLVVSNKYLISNLPPLKKQKCGAKNFLQCPLFNTQPSNSVNNNKIKPTPNLNCKSRNVVYLLQCKLCKEENSYIGRTIERVHERANIHKGCFCDKKWEDSTLSMHSTIFEEL